MEEYMPVLKMSPFFKEMTDQEILSVIHCIEGRVLHKNEGQYILNAGDTTNSMGLVLTGSVLIVQEDLWGHRNILSKCMPGDHFGEPFAVLKDRVLNISITANEDCDILFVSVGRLLKTCSSPCTHHTRLIRNLIEVMAEKTLVLNDKITHVSKRSTREKLLSYLYAESVRQGSLSFDIPYDRQQLADYLCVERSAMSAELSRLQKEGILETKKTHFILHHRSGQQ